MNATLSLFSSKKDVRVKKMNKQLFQIPSSYSLLLNPGEKKEHLTLCQHNPEEKLKNKQKYYQNGEVPRS